MRAGYEEIIFRAGCSATALMIGYCRPYSARLPVKIAIFLFIVFVAPDTFSNLRADTSGYPANEILQTAIGQDQVGVG